MRQIEFLIKNNTWAVILLAILFSFVFPNFGSKLNPYLNYLLCVLTFLSCLDLKVKEIIDSLSDFKAISLSLLIIHLASPLIVFLLRDFFSPEIFLGMVIATTIPAGRSAVFLCNIYGGQPLKALVTTSLSNMISPITVPLIVWLLAHTVIKIDPISMGKTIVWMVILPLIAAYLFGKTRPGQKLNRHSSPISTFVLFLIILGIISPIKNVIIQNPTLTFALLIIICVLILVNFYLGAHLKSNPSEKITYALSCSYKNYTLATLLSLSLFSPTVALPAIIYTIANNLMLIPIKALMISLNNEHSNHR